MSNSERDYESLVFRFEQLEQNQQVMARSIASMKRQLDNLSVQVNNQLELQQHKNLQDALAQLRQQLNELSLLPEAPVEVVNLPTEEVRYSEERQPQSLPVQSAQYQLVFDRPGSRAVLMSALLKAHKRLIIVCPWLNRNSIDANLIQKFRDCLNRNCRVEIGWGHLSDRNRIGKGWRYNALKDLRQLEQDYPEQFRLKLVGTHEKFLVCDSTFAMLGSHNFLTSSAQSGERETGIRTTDPHIIQGLIERFDGASIQDAQAIDESTTPGWGIFDDVEVLEAESISEESDPILVNPNNVITDQTPEDFDKDIQPKSVDVKEFLRLYQAGKRNFIKVNLAGANLVGVSLNDVNLSGANLTKVNLMSADLSTANLSGANLSEANLNGANLVQANLQGADLSGAILLYTKLTAASLLFANLTNANLDGTDLSAANLSQSHLRNAKFNNKTRLSGADLSHVKLLGANLQKLNFSGVNMSKANLSGALLCF